MYGTGHTCWAPCLRWGGLLGGLLMGWLVVAPAAAQPANADALREAVRTVLAERFPDDELARIEIRVKRASGDAEQVQQPRVAFRSLDELPRGAAQVRVYERRQDETRRAAGWALLYVAHYDSVLVADRTIRSGEEITRRDVRTRWVETTRFRGEPLSASVFDGEGPRFATRHLSEGRTLRAGDVRRPYAADTGQSVTVEYRRGGLHMELRCKAREPGFVGDVIRVYASGTDAAYRVRLIEPGRARWIETL